MGNSGKASIIFKLLADNFMVVEEYNMTNKRCGRITGWYIQRLIDYKDKLQATQSE